jgi:hypothetical protein
VNLLRDNIDTINKRTETLIDASKEVGLEINVEKSGGESGRCQYRVFLTWNVTNTN